MIQHASAAEAFSAAASAMAEDRDVLEIATSLLVDCAAILPAASAAILVTTPGEGLALLASTSHHADLIEMLQVQSRHGPCVDAIAAGTVMSESGAEALEERWDEVGQGMVEAGYLHVSAFPMRWHDRVLGGLNVFRAAAEPLTEDQQAVAQGFANLATLALVRPADVPVDRLSARVSEAVQSRSLVEQAKGVLAERHQVDIGTAYELLLAMVLDQDESIIAASERILDSL